MYKFTKLLLIIALFDLSAARAQESSAPDEFKLKQERAVTGSHIPRDAVSGLNVPINKAYGELTPEQKRIVRSRYEKMDDADEPPYPLKGPKELYRVISDGQNILALEGELSVFVEIDADGKPTSVGVLKSPDARMTQLIATALVNEQYKPAICKGQPCKMKYPLSINLIRIR